MPRKIIFFIKSLLLSLVIIGNIFAAEISIIPLKKPILDEEVKRQKISQGILKPKLRFKDPLRYLLPLNFFI